MKIHPLHLLTLDSMAAGWRFDGWSVGWRQRGERRAKKSKVGLYGLELGRGGFIRNEEGNYEEVCIGGVCC